jgi:(2R)-3-sulfolactate dehydrogenase (NADP+)
MAAEDGVRLPGSRRDSLAIRAADQGLDIPEALHARLVAIAAS